MRHPEVHLPVGRAIPLAVALLSLVLITNPAMAVGIWNWGPGDPNYNGAVTPQPGIFLNLPVPADFMGIANGNFPASFGSSGAAVGWDDTYVLGVGNGNTNGDAWDGLWTQIVLPNHGWWDLGGRYRTIVVSLAQDHGPYLAEGLEYHIRGCTVLFDDSSCSQADATVTDVYLDGWRAFNPAEDTNGNGWCGDDIAAVLDLGGTYPYVRLEGWSSGNALDEPEVDAMGGIEEFAPVPEFPTLAVPVASLAGLILAVSWMRRKQP